MTLSSSMRILLLALLFEINASLRQSNTLQQTNQNSIDCSGDCACPSNALTSCKLNCNGEDRCKDSTLKCKAAIPCMINCIGESSCGGNQKLDASKASDVTISCSGKDSCKGNTIIYCGTGHCTILCSTRTSCEDARLYADNALSFNCTGYCDYFKSLTTPKPQQQIYHNTTTTATTTTASISATTKNSTYLYIIDNNVTTTSSPVTKLENEVNEEVILSEETSSEPMWKMWYIEMWYIISAFIAIIAIICCFIFCWKIFCKGKMNDNTISDKSTDSAPNKVSSRSSPTAQRSGGTRRKISPKTMTSNDGGDCKDQTDD